MYYCSRNLFFIGKLRIYFVGNLKYFLEESLFHELSSKLVSSKACDLHMTSLNSNLNLIFEKEVNFNILGVEMEKGAL